MCAPARTPPHFVQTILYKMRWKIIVGILLNCLNLQAPTWPIQSHKPSSQARRWLLLWWLRDIRGGGMSHRETSGPLQLNAYKRSLKIFRWSALMSGVYPLMVRNIKVQQSSKWLKEQASKRFQLSTITSKLRFVESWICVCACVFGW